MIPTLIKFDSMQVSHVSNKRRVDYDVKYKVDNIDQPLMAWFESVNVYGFGLIAGNAISKN